MNRPSPDAFENRFAPEGLQHSLTELLQRLVRTPSRAGIDSYDGIILVLKDWLRAHDVQCRVLTNSDGRTLALVGGGDPIPDAPAYILNATVDTAGFGDPATWTRDPTGAAIENGWLYGRGSADCKAGV